MYEPGSTLQSEHLTTTRKKPNRGRVTIPTDGMPRRSSSSSGSTRQPSASRGPSSRMSSKPQSSSSAVPMRQSPNTEKQSAQPPAAYGPGNGRGTGLFGQMATTAAGVAVGHTVGNSISSALGFGGARHDDNANFHDAQSEVGGQCALQAKDFTQCLDATGNDMHSCRYYLEQLKQCQGLASQWAQ